MKQTTKTCRHAKKILNGIFSVRWRGHFSESDGFEWPESPRYRINVSVWKKFIRDYKQMIQAQQAQLAPFQGASASAIAKRKAAQKRYRQTGELFFSRWPEACEGLIKNTLGDFPALAVVYFHAKRSRRYFWQLFETVKADHGTRFGVEGRPPGPDKDIQAWHHKAERIYREVAALNGGRLYPSHAARCKEVSVRIRDQWCISGKRLQAVLRPLSRRLLKNPSERRGHPPKQGPRVHSRSNRVNSLARK